MRHAWIAVGWLIIATIVYLSLATLTVQFQVQEGDKIGHLLAYGALMAWWAQLYVSSSSRLKLALLFVLLGALVEIAQGFTPTRSPEWLDLAADAAGVLVGWVASPPRAPNFYLRLAATFPAKKR